MTSRTTGNSGRVISRRGLLERSAAAAGGILVAGAAPAFVPASALGKEGRPAPSERIGVGVIGTGSRGGNHFDASLGFSNTQVLAACDPQSKKAQHYKAKAEAHYAKTAPSGTYKGCAAYQDFRELTGRDDIDAVFIAAPENWHVLTSIYALKAGKDVYCEKALSLTVAEGRALIGVVRRYGRVFQIGTQQRSDRNFRFACELARNGFLGKVHTVKVGVPGGRSLPNAEPKPAPPDIDYEMWLGPAPWTPYNDLKCSFNWYFILDYCVGWVQSWGVHHTDIALWGQPTLGQKTITIEGKATYPTEGLANTSITWNITYTTPAGLVFNFTDNKQNPQGVQFIGDKGSVHVWRGGIKAEPASLLRETIGPDQEHLYESNSHHGNFLECIKTRRDPVAPVEAGHAATAITIVGDIACRLGRKLTWNWETEKFVNDEVADRMLSRAYRKPWRI